MTNQGTTNQEQEFDEALWAAIIEAYRRIEFDSSDWPVVSDKIFQKLFGSVESSSWNNNDAYVWHTLPNGQRLLRDGCGTDHDLLRNHTTGATSKIIVETVKPRMEVVRTGPLYADYDEEAGF